MSDTVTIPTWLYEKMAEVYYGQKFGLTIDHPWEKSQEHQPRAPEQVPLEPPKTFMGEVNLKDVDLIMQKVPAGYVPRGIAAKKAKPQEDTELDGN